MSTEHERDYVAKMYPGRGWRNKVKKMSDAQVLAIYIKDKNRKKKENDK